MPEQASIIVGTRASALARAQTAEVVAELCRRIDGLRVEVRTITTLGDRDRRTPLASMGSHGVFASELERALLERTIDLAVHSFKDLPTEETAGLTVAAVPRRAEPFDVLVLREASSLRELASGSRVAAGHPRRSEALRCVRGGPRVRGGAWEHRDAPGEAGPGGVRGPGNGARGAGAPGPSREDESLRR